MRAGQAAAAFVAIVAIASCRAVVGIADPAPPLRCRAPSPAVSPACEECALDRCCAELETCNADPACTSLVACRAKCSDDACRDQCEKAGLPETAASFLACEAKRCEQECGLACGGAGSPFDGCSSCGASCCAEGKAFRADRDGQALRACRARCKSDATCVEGCVEAHSVGADLETGAVACVKRACGLDGNFSCAGHVERLSRSGPLLTLRVQAIDSGTQKPLGGVVVKGCDATDLKCAAPRYGSMITDANGAATITIPSNGLDSAGYLGFLEADLPGYAPALFFFTPPLVADLQLGLPLLAQNVLAKTVEAAIGRSPRSDRGIFAFATGDCAQRATSGVSVAASTADALSEVLYERPANAGGGYNRGGTTTPLATGLLVDLPPGPMTFTTRLDAMCLELGRATIAIRAGAVSFAGIPPLPAPSP